MKERGIPFSGPMVRAILSGAKTQTRRLYKPREGSPYEIMEELDDGRAWPHWFDPNRGPEYHPVQCPYGNPGHRLWVRETFAAIEVPQGFGRQSRTEYVYRATDEEAARRYKAELLRWRPSIHLPRAASRITLEVTEVRVQRLQDISEEDAKAEGVVSAIIPANEDMPNSVGYVFGRDDGKCTLFPTQRRAFEVGWDSINGDRASWASNPWVWALSFKRVTP